MAIRILPPLIFALLASCATHETATTLPAAPATQPAAKPEIPTLYIIGDSTVKNRLPRVGWGDPIVDYFDLTRLHVENDAASGRSSRTFITEGRWEAVRAKLHKGDFLLLQFGHNDTKAPISAQRYSLPGLGDETEDGVDPATKEKIQIHTYGWYMHEMIAEAQTAGTTPIVFSSIPRCKWAGGKIVRGEENHVLWASQIAAKMGVDYVDLNALIADFYDPCGQKRIKALYFPTDNTHTNLAGAEVNAACVVIGLMKLPDDPLRAYLIPTAADQAAAATVIPPMPLVPATTQSSATRP